MRSKIPPTRHEVKFDVVLGFDYEICRRNLGVSNHFRPNLVCHDAVTAPGIVVVAYALTAN